MQIPTNTMSAPQQDSGNPFLSTLLTLGSLIPGPHQPYFAAANAMFGAIGGRPGAPPTMTGGFNPLQGQFNPHGGNQQQGWYPPMIAPDQQSAPTTAEQSRGGQQQVQPPFVGW